jgi:hypothetical protein
MLPCATEIAPPKYIVQEKLTTKLGHWYNMNADALLTAIGR